MNQNAIIGRNIRLYREKSDITQDELAKYLGIKREEVSYYETGKRNVPTQIISEAAKLFAIDEYDLFEEDSSMQNVKFAFAFRADELSADDFGQIASFNKIVLNYLNMKKVILDE